MPYINTDLINKLPEEDRDRLVYRPDVLPFNHSATDYETHWQKLLDSAYRYSNGYEIRPCSFFQYSLQLVKGRLGFNNYCHPATLDLALKKLAYYGYLRDYSPDCLNDVRHGFTRDFMDLITARRSNIRSGLIQKVLFDAFKRHETLSNPAFSLSSNDRVFGATLKQCHLWSEIPALDPQENALIDEAMDKLPEIEHDEAMDKLPEIAHSVLPRSRFAHRAAQHYLEKAESIRLTGDDISTKAKANRYLGIALMLHSGIAVEKPSAFIRYYLEQQNPEAAYQLIEKIGKIESTSLAASLLLQHFSEEQQKQWVKPGSPLGVILAAYYLQKKPGPPGTDTIQLALQFDNQLDVHAPAQVLALRMAQQNYEQAYTIVSKNPNITFPKPTRQTLSDYFNEQANTAEKDHRYEDSLNARKKAWEMRPTTLNQAAYESQKKRYEDWIIDIPSECHCTI